MSRSDGTVRERQEHISHERRAFFGMIGRMLVRVTRGDVWNLEGRTLISGEKETVRAQVFHGIGRIARPKAGRNVEAIVVREGAAAENPTIVAHRDLDTQKAVFPNGIGEDEQAVFNSVTLVYNRSNGTVEIRTPGGTALALPTLAEHNALRSFVAAQFSGAGHTHHVTGSATDTTAPVGAPPGAATGTSVLKTH